MVLCEAAAMIGGPHSTTFRAVRGANLARRAAVSAPRSSDELTNRVTLSLKRAPRRCADERLAFPHSGPAAPHGLTAMRQR
jgi:hypothetical protein